MFALVDCNNFYASCERVFQPNLQGKPIVVLSNNDGCIIARSNEAKELGIPMGAPYFQYEQVFKKHSVSVFSPNFALYGDMSHRVMTILAEYTLNIEIYSIDEAFLKLDGFELFDLQNYGETIQKRIGKWTGIPVCIGIAPTKSLAKIANKIAKKFQLRTKSVYIINTDEKRIKALAWTKIEDVWGIGRKYAKRLHEANIKTALDFINLEDAWVKKNLSIVGLRLKQDLQGIPTLDLEAIRNKQNIATTRSFEKNYTELEQVSERITTFAVACAEKLRKQKSCCNTIMVFIHTNFHKKDSAQYNRNIVIKLPYPTNSNIELAKFANQALRKIFKPGYLYKKAGVVVMDFSPENQKQLTLFEPENAKHSPLMKAVDIINERYGQQKIKLASQDLQKVWKMKQEKLSPRYTTKLEDIITIIAK